MENSLRLDRITITMRDGKPVIRVAVEADSTVISIKGTKTVTERLALHETPAFKVLEPDLVQSIISSVEETVRNNVQRLK